MPLYSYVCPDEHSFDELRPIDKRENCRCPTCGKKAKRTLTAARIDYYNMGVSSDFPTCLDKWEKMHKKEAQREYD
jgi:putative FmdB family regulatory protein